MGRERKEVVGLFFFLREKMDFFLGKSISWDPLEVLAGWSWGFWGSKRGFVTMGSEIKMDF